MVNIDDFFNKNMGHIAYLFNIASTACFKETGLPFMTERFKK